jgi:hypothetical protein
VNDPKLEARIIELEAKILELESTWKDHHGNKYIVRDHPRWAGKEGNPYLPLDENGNMRKGFLG